MKRTLKNTRGITLIALVVTIIVLLILAGVSITAVFGEKGLLKQVEIAKERNIMSAYQDEADRALLTAKTICIAENRNSDIVSEAKKELEKSNLFKDATFSEITGGEFTISTKDGYTITVKEDGATVTKQGTASGENLKVQISQENDEDETYGCVKSSTIKVSVIKDTGYTDYMDYYLKAKASQETKERMFYIYYSMSNSSNNQALFTLLQTLKANNKTISQYVEETYNTTLDNGIYTNWKKADKNTQTYSLYGLPLMDREQEIASIISSWNTQYPSQPATTIDQVATYAYGQQITVEQLATQLGCAQEVGLDYLYTILIILTGKTNYTDLEEFANKYTALENEYTQMCTTTTTAKIKLPNGTEKNANSVSYTVDDNGTYEFEVTYNGKTEKYSKTVSEIAHNSLNGQYSSNNNGTHEMLCDCGESQTEACMEEPSGTQHYTDNGNGTHTIAIEGSHCIQCQGVVTEDQTIIEEHNISYNPTGVNEHSIICGDESGTNGCGNLGTEACTDANGDGTCDLCGQIISTE